MESQVFLTNDISANDPTCDADPCKALRKQIEDRDDVRSVRFLNRDDAYDDAIKKFPQYKDVAGKDAFPASFIVKLDDPEQHKDFDDAIVGQPGVLNVLNQKDLIDRLFAVLDGLSNAAFAVALVQAVGAILLIANMVQVAAYTRRTEIGIMRLVGASRWYTQLPFLVEAMLAAFIGVVIAIVGLIVGAGAVPGEGAQPVLPSQSDRQDRLRRHPLSSRPSCCSWWAWRWPVSRRTSRCACTCGGSRGEEVRPPRPRRRQQPGGRDQSQGAAQLFDPRHVRGRRRADGHRGEEPARRAGVAGRRVRHRRRRRDLAAQPAHPGVSPRAAGPTTRRGATANCCCTASQIDNLVGKIRDGNLTLVPLSLYFTDGKVKVELALARGKQAHDKRQDMAKRDADREVTRELGRRAKGMT